MGVLCSYEFSLDAFQIVYFMKQGGIMEHLDIIRSENIVVEAEQVPGKVSFDNFAELKQYMEKGLSVYNTSEYTVDNLKQAEQDLKELKAIKKKLTDKKKT